MTATVSATVDASSAAPQPNSHRWRLVVVVAVVIAVIGVLAVAGLRGTLVYYRSPTGLLRDPGLVGKHVRIGGLVQVGSLHRRGDLVTFTLTDGVSRLPVRFTGPVNGVFAPGRDALVDGRLTRTGVFDGDQLMVKHDNSYGPKKASTPASATVGGGR